MLIPLDHFRVPASLQTGHFAFGGFQITRPSSSALPTRDKPWPEDGCFNFSGGRAQ